MGLRGQEKGGRGYNNKGRQRGIMESGAGNINGHARPSKMRVRAAGERASERGKAKGWNIKGRNEKRPSPLHR